MNSTCRILLTGLVAILVAFELFGAPAPKSVRSLEEDQALLLQKDGDKWMAPPVTIERDGRKITFRPFLIIGKPNENTIIKGLEEFLKKPGVKGILHYGIEDKEKAEGAALYYRLVERDKERFLVIPDRKGGEIEFSYEIEDNVFRLKGGKAISYSEKIGSLDLACEYKRK